MVSKRYKAYPPAGYPALSFCFSVLFHEAPGQRKAPRWNRSIRCFCFVFVASRCPKRTVWFCFLFFRQFWRFKRLTTLISIASSIWTGGVLDPPLAAGYFADILAGLEYLHLHLIAHRDLKPEVHERKIEQQNNNSHTHVCVCVCSGMGEASSTLSAPILHQFPLLLLSQRWGDNSRKAALAPWLLALLRYVPSER